MNRKWLFGGVAGALALAAVLALIGGGAVGRSIVPDSPAPAEPQTTRFKDTLTDVSIAYPADWVRRAPQDQGVRLIASTQDASAGLSVSVRKSGIEDAVTTKTLPVVRPLTDDLLRSERRITKFAPPTAVTIGGLPGYRYVYTYASEGGTEGAHLHYFLFKAQQLIQIVLQAVPASRLPALEPTFEKIAASFQGTAP